MNYYIDLGSSTVKLYEHSDILKLVEEKSIHFKNEFSEEKGISEDNLNELIKFLTDMKAKYELKFENTFIYATGIFRKMDDNVKTEYIKIFNDKLDLYFNIISHGIENYYLEKAMNNDYNNKKVLVINMGGKTTELVSFHNNKIINTHNLNVGVADILNNFPEVNDENATCSFDDIINFVDEKILDVTLDNDYDCAIFTGGEERFEKLTNYSLIENTLFNDNIHKYMISYDDYMSCTHKVFYDKEYTLEKLHSLMPHNPTWMDGARAGALLPVPLFKKANIKYIVPSDLNLINGVINDK